MQHSTAMRKLKEGFSLPLGGVRPDSVLALLSSVGYEVWVPFEYAERTGTKIVQLEDEILSRRIEKRFLEDIFNDSTKKSIIDMLKLPPRVLKLIFDFSYEFERPKDEDEDITETVERNKIFVDKISSLDGRVLAVTGKGHVYGREPTLKTLLKEYNPRDFKLIETDYWG